MSKHFIKNIEIKNFKCFENFKAEGFGRVNLIGGKNNVGKTAFMEACRTNIYANNIGHFIVSLVKNKNSREILNYYNEYTQNSTISFLDRFIKIPLRTIKHVNIKSNIRETIFTPLEKDGILTYQCEIDNKEFFYNPNENMLIPQGNDNISLITTYGLSNSDIVQRYASLQKADKENFLNNSLSVIDRSISSFKIIEEKPYCKLNNQYIELTELGDGTQQFIAIILSLFQSQDGTLFIDEIGNGIHYTNLDKLWEIILTISKDQNVQVFATTHSKECIESYARVAKKLEDEEITYSILSKLKSGEILHTLYNSEILETAINQEHEVR